MITLVVLGCIYVAAFGASHAVRFGTGRFFEATFRQLRTGERESQVGPYRVLSFRVLAAQRFTILVEPSRLAKSSPLSVIIWNPVARRLPKESPQAIALRGQSVGLFGPSLVNCRLVDLGWGMVHPILPRPAYPPDWFPVKATPWIFADLAVIALIISGTQWFARKARDAVRLRGGRCLRCGYSKSAESVCPECGTR